MSKAFTRESDDPPEVIVKKPISVPSKNYITLAGLDRLRKELEQLSRENSPRRISEIQEILQSALPVSPPLPPWDQVLFGATVTVRDQSNQESRYRIVGIHEVDLARNWISWISPLGKALLKSRIGDRVHFRAPDGEQILEILSVRYE